MTKWSKVMKNHKESLVQAMALAFCNAVDRRDMQFVVELNSDGEAKIKEYPAGESNISYAVWKGANRIINTFCFQNMDICPEEHEWLEEYKEKYAYITACTLVRDAIATESELEE